jgi:hypothetical protein
MRLLLFFLLFSGFSFAQNWAPTGAQWHYSCYGDLQGGYVDIVYAGDTVIDSQVTKKLVKTRHNYGLGSVVNSYDIGREYTYEDNGVVYLRYQNHWDTLYNINAQIGDSWRMVKQPLFVNLPAQNSRLKVLATGTKVINNETLKYVKVEFVDPQLNPLGFEDTIVENIGFIGSYLLPYDMFDGAFGLPEGGPFRCYTAPNFATYKPNYWDPCDFIVGIEELSRNFTFQVFPNPVSDQINIPAAYTTEFTAYSIYSTEGKLVQSGQTSAQINVANLPIGNYTLVIQNKTQNRYAKVLVVR